MVPGPTGRHGQHAVEHAMAQDAGQGHVQTLLQPTVGTSAEGNQQKPPYVELHVRYL